MSKICLCLTANTLSHNLEILNQNRKYVDMAELRVDCLDPDERFHIRSFPEMAGLPVILTIRRDIEGGKFTGGEASRITLLAKGLAYAVADQRRNFAYVDLEEDLDVPSLEEAARAFGTRIIRSRHNLEGVDDDLAEKLIKLRRVGDEIVKATVKPNSLEDLANVYRAAKETERMDKIIFCMGDYGVNTRILAEVLGSRLSYTSPSSEGSLPSAAELAELYRFHNISAKTKIFAITASPFKVMEIIRFFNTVFRMEQDDAVLVPIPSGSVDSLFHLAEESGILGFSITLPLNEEILPYLTYKSREIIPIGACNTVIPGAQGWVGYNTEAAGFSDSLLSFTGRKDLKGRKITIIGAGGAARTAAAEVSRLKGKALILNRTSSRARSLAEQFSFAWAGLDSRGANLMHKYSHIIIQASTAGMYPNTDEDPIEFYNFTGREAVMDLVCKPEKTRCLKRAEDSGCRVLNGLDMLHRQLRYQYNYFLNKEFPLSLASRVDI